MRITLLLSAVTTLALAATAQAQAPAARGADREARRERVAERREQIKNMTPEQREAAKARLAERRDARLENASPEMRTWLQARQEAARSVAQQVKSGALTREQAKAQLQQWAQSNPRPGKSS
jgi:hypothetical protein